MKTKKIIVLFSSVLAFVAVVVGLFCYFFSVKPVRDMPETLQMCIINNEYVLEAEYGGEKYAYEFQLEQKFDGQFVVVATVASKVNNIKLIDHNLQIIDGEEYRFCARYTYENEKGSWSKFLEGSVGNFTCCELNTRRL